ncbi:MAG: glycosyltransferase family 4 protein [Balneolaceae bacterium]
MLRILLFSPKGAGTHYFGPGMSAYNMYRRLDPKVARVSLVHGYPDQEESDLFEHQYYISDLTSNGPRSMADFLWNAKKWIRKHAGQFDVVHCLTAFHTSFLFALWCEKVGVPAFIKIAESKHTGFTESSTVSNLLGLKKFRIRNANRITGYISISSAIREKLIEAGIDEHRIVDIPNGVDTERFHPAGIEEKRQARNDLGLKDTFTVIFTGAFNKRKNPFLVLQAFADLPDCSDYQLLLIGPDRDDGEERAKISGFINEKKLSHVHVLPFVHDIETCYRASDLFVLPSREEGLSNSLLEAQSCGLPAIVTPVSGAEDLIEEGVNGSFIDYTSEHITRAMNRFIRDRELHTRASSMARNQILEQYDSRIILKKHMEMFQGSISGKS